ncbi:unnamed protein product [Eruca vesicaria subsp. sativa]|uniref:Uncharacterized protein n=1 Tax=Eruca vesicaria subsp. sativa TaxID=29727 RepID=A0ABC8KBA2_ERUVS|nr:unnamed protein product [Eruca vesicaria subsp. sativa]
MKAKISCSRRKRDFLRGIPSHCWCGNPVLREGETHLFKWFDKTLVEEVSMVEARQTTIEKDLEAMVTAEFSATREVRENTGCNYVS